MNKSPNFYSKVYSYENLLLAWQKAKKGKTKRRYVKRFQKNLKANLLGLQEKFISETYQPCKLKTFPLRDPKTRKISKSAFKDRIVHHAICNIIAPLFEKNFIYDSHANQKGKGTLRALERFDTFKRKVSKNNIKECYVLKADIKHYFEEINHEILLKIIRKRINDEKVIELIQKILTNGGGRACLRRRN